MTREGTRLFFLNNYAPVLWEKKAWTPLIFSQSPFDRLPFFFLLFNIASASLEDASHTCSQARSKSSSSGRIVNFKRAHVSLQMIGWGSRLEIIQSLVSEADGQTALPDELLHYSSLNQSEEQKRRARLHLWTSDSENRSRCISAGPGTLVIPGDGNSNKYPAQRWAQSQKTTPLIFVQEKAMSDISAVALRANNTERSDNKYLSTGWDQPQSSSLCREPVSPKFSHNLFSAPWCIFPFVLVHLSLVGGTSTTF